MNKTILFILSLLKSNEGMEIKGKLCFQKEMFLIVKEIYPELDNELHFEPYHYGPFSKNLAELLDSLKEESLIEVKETANSFTYSITSQGIKKLTDECNLPDNILQKISNLKKTVNKLGYKGLLRYVYFNYPEYTKNSKIKNEVLGET